MVHFNCYFAFSWSNMSRFTHLNSLLMAIWILSKFRLLWYNEVLFRSSSFSGCPLHRKCRSPCPLHVVLGGHCGSSCFAAIVPSGVCCSRAPFSLLPECCLSLTVSVPALLWILVKQLILIVRLSHSS